MIRGYLCCLEIHPKIVYLKIQALNIWKLSKQRSHVWYFLPFVYQRFQSLGVDFTILMVSVCFEIEPNPKSAVLVTVNELPDTFFVGMSQISF